MELAQQLLAQMSPAIAALQPFLNVVGTLKAVVDFASAVPKILVDPTALVDPIKELVKNIEKLLITLPPLPIAILIVDVLDIIISYVSGLSEVLVALADQEERINTAVALAEEQHLDALRQAAECASQTLANQLANIQASSGPIDAIIGLLNSLVRLVPGCSEIPLLGSPGDSIEEMSDGLNGFVQVIRSIRNAIPIS
jgi:hypothetical protein